MVFWTLWENLVITVMVKAHMHTHTHTHTWLPHPAPPHFQTHLTSQPSSSVLYMFLQVVLFSECMWAADEGSAKTANILRNRLMIETLAAYQWTKNVCTCCAKTKCPQCLEMCTHIYLFNSINVFVCVLIKHLLRLIWITFVYQPQAYLRQTETSITLKFCSMRTWEEQIYQLHLEVIFTKAQLTGVQVTSQKKGLELGKRRMLECNPQRQILFALFVYHTDKKTNV